MAASAHILSALCVYTTQNRTATVGPRGYNANRTFELSRRYHAAELLGQQFGVFGPIPFLVLLWRTVAWIRGRATAAERYLLALALPPLLVVTAQAFLSRANANWAVTAYPTASSEEGRVGKECVSTCRYRGSPYH